MATVAKTCVFEIRWEDGAPRIFSHDLPFDSPVEVACGCEETLTFFVRPHPPAHPGLLRLVEPLKIVWDPEKPKGIEESWDDAFQLTLTIDNSQPQKADRQVDFSVYVHDGRTEHTVRIRAGLEGEEEGADPTLIIKGTEGPPVGSGP